MTISQLAGTQHQAARCTTRHAAGNCLREIELLLHAHLWCAGSSLLAGSWPQAVSVLRARDAVRPVLQPYLQCAGSGLLAGMRPQAVSMLQTRMTEEAWTEWPAGQSLEPAHQGLSRPCAPPERLHGCACLSVTAHTSRAWAELPAGQSLQATHHGLSARAPPEALHGCAFLSWQGLQIEVEITGKQKLLQGVQKRQRVPKRGR